MKQQSSIGIISPKLMGPRSGGMSHMGNPGTLDMRKMMISCLLTISRSSTMPMIVRSSHTSKLTAAKFFNSIPASSVPSSTPTSTIMKEVRAESSYSETKCKEKWGVIRISVTVVRIQTKECRVHAGNSLLILRLINIMRKLWEAKDRGVGPEQNSTRSTRKRYKIKTNRHTSPIKVEIWKDWNQRIISTCTTKKSTTSPQEATHR